MQVSQPEMTVSRQQAEFDQKYVSSYEIRSRLKIPTCTLAAAQRRNLLPKPIRVGMNLHLWEREEIEPFIEAWDRALTTRRNTAAEINR